MSVLDELQATVATQRAILSALEPGCLSGPDALRLLEVITEGERVLARGGTLMAKRVEASNVWRASGDRCAAHFIARQPAERRAHAGGVGDGRTPGRAARHRRGVPRRGAVGGPGRGGSERGGREPERAATPAERAEGDTAKQLRDECRGCATRPPTSAPATPPSRPIATCAPGPTARARSAGGSAPLPMRGQGCCSPSTPRSSGCSIPLTAEVIGGSRSGLRDGCAGGPGV